MNKRGYLFTGDIIVAITLLSLGMILLYYNFSGGSYNTYFTEKLSTDILGVLSFTKLSDLCKTTGPPVSCPNYSNLTNLIDTTESSGERKVNYNDDLLTFISFLLEADIASATEVKGLLHEIFVTNKVVDESRFGFSLLYRAGDGQVLSIYNVETTTP